MIIFSDYKKIDRIILQRWILYNHSKQAQRFKNIYILKCAVISTMNKFMDFVTNRITDSTTKLTTNRCQTVFGTNISHTIKLFSPIQTTTYKNMTHMFFFVHVSLSLSRTLPCKWIKPIQMYGVQCNITTCHTVKSLCLAQAQPLKLESPLYWWEAVVDFNAVFHLTVTTTESQWVNMWENRREKKLYEIHNRPEFEHYNLCCRQLSTE